METLPEVDNSPWWEAVERGELTYQRCTACRAPVFYPRSHCPGCLSSALEWSTSSGKGQVYAFTIVRRPVKGFEARVPYVVALVDLEEGFRLMTNIVDVQPENVLVGMPVQVDFQRDHTGKMLPYFRPAR